MGAWGLGAFQNDDAGDWTDRLLFGNNLNPVFDVFSEILNNDGYIELPESCAGLAAVEVVASLRGNSNPNLPEKVTVWILSHRMIIDNRLVESAKDVVDKIRTNSELRELVEEVGKLDEWYAILDELKSRLK